jgi:DNA-binding LacI/PurR family transcriptional regulator
MRKSNTIGIFILSRYQVASEENTAYKFLGGIIETANKNHYDVVLFSTDSTLLKNKTYMELCQERQVEGAIFIGLEIDNPHLKELENSPIPICLIDGFLDGKNVVSVSGDNVKGIRQALEYLAELGHEQIGFVNGHMKAFVSHLRFKEYKKFMAEKNIDTEEYIYDGDFSIEKGYELGKEIAKSNNRPSALLISGDLSAYGVIKGLKDEGIKIPEDISIISFDNFKMNDYLTPELTSISQGIDEMGRNAAEALFEILKNGEAENRTLETSLVVRNSCKKKS